MSTKHGTVALCISIDQDLEKHSLIEAISDDHEISILEKALSEGKGDPLAIVHELRENRAREEEEFGIYVEDLLSEPFVRPNIQEQALQWLKSKIRIEEFQRSEAEATQVIADYAYEVFKEDPNRDEFVLAGSSAAVKIRIFRFSKSLSKSGESRYPIAS